MDYSIFLKIFQELSNYEISQNYIRTQALIDIVLKKYLIDNNCVGLPNIFKHIGFYNIKKFLTLLENIPYYSINTLETDYSNRANFNEYYIILF
jgi:hypothetical protein